MKAILATIMLMIFLSSCLKHQNSNTKANAEIISFNAEKCICCWGWTVIKGNDTVKIDSLPHDVQIGYEINEPIPVYIELGSKIRGCSFMKMYDYYKIKKLEIIR